MTDKISQEKRSENMRAVRTRDTTPEVTVRKLLHHLGYRFRLHATDLPGKPDIIFRNRKAVIFIHGCFWHGHTCKRGMKPKSNTDFWNNKLETNILRDQKQLAALRKLGWRPLVVWECQIKNLPILTKRLKRFLSD